MSTLPDVTGGYPEEVGGQGSLAEFLRSFSNSESQTQDPEALERVLNGLKALTRPEDELGA